MTQAQLPGVFGQLQPVLEHYGYLAVGGFVLLEDFGVPQPGETILIAAAIFAGSGHMNIAAVIVVAVIAAIIGDNIGFVIGHFGGRPLVHRFAPCPSGASSAALGEFGGQLFSCFDVELVEDPVEVALDGLSDDEERLGDFGVR